MQTIQTTLHLLLFFITSIVLSGCRTLGNIPADILLRPTYTDNRAYVESKERNEIERVKSLDDDARVKTHYQRHQSQKNSKLGMPAENSETKLNNKFPRFYPGSIPMNFTSETARFSKHVIYNPERPTDCKTILHFQKSVQSKNINIIKDYLKHEAAKLYANTIYLYDIDRNDLYSNLDAEFYNCETRRQRQNLTTTNISQRSTTEVDFHLGTYYARNGFLKDLGETGPTLGFTFAKYSKNDTHKNSKLNIGWYLHFNFDHFVDTKSSFLKPKFTDESFTNYLWSFGPSIRYLLSDQFLINYNVGPGINFLEINTSGSNQEITDEEATRTTLSFVHKLGFYTRLENNIKDGDLTKTDTLLGVDLFYYWMPDTLGKFAHHNSDIESYAGGSMAILFSLKMQSF